MTAEMTTRWWFRGDSRRRDGGREEERGLRSTVWDAGDVDDVAGAVATEAHTQQQPQGSAVLGVAGQWAETAALVATP
jgi:hypothetical protein